MKKAFEVAFELPVEDQEDKDKDGWTPNDVNPEEHSGVSWYPPSSVLCA